MDRHLDALGDKTAIIWAQDEPGVYTHITYRELKHRVCRVANVLLHLSTLTNGVLNMRAYRNMEKKTGLTLADLSAPRAQR